MSTEPTSIEGSVTPPTSVASENSGVGASIQTKGTTSGKRKAPPQRDVLAIPISTVASEFAFSTGGRVLDQYKSSLTPKIIQVLVCTQDWIRKSSSQEDIKKIEEQIQELDKIENGLMQMGIFWRDEMDINEEY
ncbi:uncharacterized protein [Gossypium hirsutum]|uniref:Uncharacterized protein isoform X2 n=1 Tax=Gossypium hirsutum TaxID=3635 RepID=A0ABM3B7E6_GOSHI|nr:uncharacterized protein LOC121224205 isoform X2 [Gossypium hirsutum]